MPRILQVSSECAPLVKTGGLADVVGALPGAMAPLGWGMRTLLPGYPAVMAALEGAQVVADWPDLLRQRARLVAGRTAGGLDLLVVEAPALYARPGGPYLNAEGRDWPDNDLRFAALCLAAARIARGDGGWRPELVHLHDWQAGLTPVYMAALEASQPSVFTIHNIAFHGLTGGERRAALALPEASFTLDGYEYYGHVSALKAGLVGASALSTVSPTYAQELTTPEFGMGLDGVIRARAGALSGILNGVDTDLWNPATDPAIRPYSRPAGKAANRKRLRGELALRERAGPLCIVVSRLSDQKGLDLLLQALPALLDGGGQLALLGAGDRRLENAWLDAAAGNPDVRVRIGYDEGLAHRMFAGGDAVLVPSRFEPCGLTQLYGLRYGTLPVVARTGGLADTVIHANDAALVAGVATGISHHAGDAAALAHALRQLCALWADGPTRLRMQRNAMKHPVGWEASAPRYGALYARLIEGTHPA